MYSQNNEEEIILAHCGPTAKFLDIGAYDPFTFSNTRCLVEKGWQGVFVEPSPTCVANFYKEYSGNPAITIIEAAIDEKNGTAMMYDSQGDALSTFSDRHYQVWRNYRDFTQVEVNTMAMSDLLSQHAEGVTFLNLDVEGMNLKLFRLLPLDFLKQLTLICVEHEGHDHEIRQTLYPLGFKEYLLNAENIVLSKI